MMGLTMPQARQLKEWMDNLWVLLDQDDYNKIAEIFKNAVDWNNNASHSFSDMCKINGIIKQGE